MSSTAPSFENEIKPLFRESDREAMLQAFDLWSFDDVTANGDRILGALSAGSMPCDGPWPSDKVDLFKRWIDEGTPA
jgi:hypothetical protein